ncbi:MAG: hypothetical protein WC405_11060 [Syntrophales bacterium]
MTQAYEKEQLCRIPIVDFKPDSDQPWKVIDPNTLSQLAGQIFVREVV